MPGFISLWLAVMVASPIWPLGTNPLPGDPFIIINKQTNEAALITSNRVQEIVSVTTGKEDELTPEGLFTVTVKAKNPYYRRKDIPGGTPENPLGSRWIGFDAEETDGRIFGIHGTNKPESIGKKLSQGCIRMQNKSVESWYEFIPLGTKVLITSSTKTFLELAEEQGAISK